MRKSLLTLGLVMIASTSLASNTGFKLNYPIPLKPTPLSSTYLIGYPTFYYPNGNVGTVGAQNSLDLCSDMNDFGTPGANASKVARFNPATDLYVTQSCVSAKKAFDLTAGEGYAVSPAVGTVNAVVNIVGSNDDLMTSNKGNATNWYNLTKYPAPLSSLHVSSIPYHVKSNNSVDVCNELRVLTVPVNQIQSVARFNPDTDLFVTQSCASAKKAFDLVPGEGYGITPVTTQKIAFDVY